MRARSGRALLLRLGLRGSRASLGTLCSSRGKFHKSAQSVERQLQEQDEEKKRDRERRTTPIHLNSPKPLLLPLPRALNHITRFIPADPSVDCYAIANFAAEERVHGDGEALAFYVPEGYV